MVKPYSWRPTNNLEKMSIAQFFAYRLRTLVSYPIRIFLVGSVASMTAHLYSDIDIRVCCDNHNMVEKVLGDSQYHILRTIERLKEDPTEGRVRSFHHIYIDLSHDVEGEVVVRGSLDSEVQIPDSLVETGYSSLRPSQGSLYSRVSCLGSV